MSQEPPRIVNPNQFATNARRPSRAKRIILIGLGVLFSFLFLCSGAAYMLYRRFNANSNFGGSYAELREPIGGTVSDQVRDASAESMPSDEKDAVDFGESISNFGVEVDVGRFVMEMQRSGKSVGSVNPLTRWFWQVAVKDAIEAPDFGASNTVLNFEWLVPEKEARAVVACFPEYGGAETIYVLYLIRTNDGWKLFDWRDVLAPMNESQYWAIYAALPERTDQVYSNFTQEAFDICSDYEAPNQKKITELMSRYRSTKFPRQYNMLANDLVCSYLVALDAKAELALMSDKLTANDFAGALVYKSISAHWAGDSAKAFQHLKELQDRLGWHPRAASLAGEFAETAEQKQLAAQWLQRSVLLAPKNASVINTFLTIADREQFKSMLSGLAKSPTPAKTVIGMTKALEDISESKLKWLLESLPSGEGMVEVREFLELQLAIEREDHASVMKMAPAVLSGEEFVEDDYSYYSNNVWSSFVRAARQTKSLDQAVASLKTEDLQQRFRELLRDDVFYSSEDMPLDEALACLRSMPQDSDLWAEWRTQIAIARLQQKQGKSSEAFDALLAFYKSHADEVEEDERINDTIALLTALAEFGLECERWQELANEMDHETLFLLMTNGSPSNPQALQQFVDWYAALPDQVESWLQYYGARIAFLKGDWPTADQGLKYAITLAEADSRIADEELPPLIASFAPQDYGYSYEDDLLSNWYGLRFEFAVRCDALDKLLADAQQAEEVDEQWLESLEANYFGSSPATLARVAGMLRGMETNQASKIAADLEIVVASANARYDEAVKQQLEALRTTDENQTSQDFAVQRAGDLILVQRSTKNLDALRQLSRGGKMGPYVDCVAATLAKDAKTLADASAKWVKSEWLSSDFISNPLVLDYFSDSDKLRELTQKQPITLEQLEQHNLHAAIALSAEPNAAFSELKQHCESKSIAIEQLDAARFDQASAACVVTVANTKLVITFTAAEHFNLSTTPGTRDHLKETKTIAAIVSQDIAGSIFALRRTLRSGINELLAGMPSSVAMIDVENQNSHCKEGWQQRFGSALDTGIDPASPEEFYLPIFAKQEAKQVERDGKQFAVLEIGLVRELIPIELEKQETPWQATKASSLAPSLTVPQLLQGVHVRWSDD